MALIVKEKIRHNGTEFKKGDLIEGLSKKEEGRLIELGVAEKASQPKKEKGKDGE